MSRYAETMFHRALALFYVVCVCIVFVFVNSAEAVPQEVAAVKAELDVPPSTTQKPYSPADEQRVPVNPPPFIWVPGAEDATYALQLSSSETFVEADTFTFHDIATSVFVPREPLEPGDWFWRYGIETTESVVWGRARPFTVLRDAREFPFPDLEECMARIPKERPRLFFPRERLEQAREYARGALQSQVDSLLRRCEQVIGEEIVAEPPRPTSGPERVYVMRTTRPPMDEMERCALAYLLTGDEKLGQEAKRRLLHFFSWNPNGPTSLWSYDEPAMWMMMRGTRAYDWTHDLFTPEEREDIEPVMKIRAEHFYQYLKRLPFESNPYDSHAGRMPGFLGEAAICFAHEWPDDARRWMEYATLLYYTSYPAWGGDEGGWQEGPGYWGAYMNFALHYVIALRRATGVDLMQKPFFRNTGYYALYTATPYHEHSPYGDGQTGNPTGLGGVMYAFSTLAQNPYFRWYQEASGRSVGDGLLTLATYDPNLEAKHPKDLPHGRYFPANGLAAIHTTLGDKENDITFLMRSSPYGSVSHGHADQNAFVIEAFGKGLAIATGYYPWYGSPHHSDWTRATRAKNSILVNGEGQVRRSWDASGEITAFELGEGYDYAEGEAAKAYAGRLDRFRRHVVHVRPGVFVMFDDVIAKEPSTFQWLLHAYDEIGIEDRVLRVRRSPAAMDVHLLLPADLNVSQTDQYDPPPEQVELKPSRYESTWHLTAATTQPATAAQFLSVFLVYRDDSGDQLPRVGVVEGDGALGVRLARPDGVTDLVGFRTDSGAGKVSWDQFTIDARVFAVGYDRRGDIVRRMSLR